MGDDTSGSDDIRLILGACEDVLAGLPAESVDAIVTDPPYGIKFMGRKWDYEVPTVAQWEACLRVLKPGGHLLSFAGTRTQHRMAVRIEDAGFEIRDMIAWVYGSGFPKSLDVSKAIDKARDDDNDRLSVGVWLREQRESVGLRQKDVASHWPSVTGGLTGCVANWELGLSCPKWDQWLDLKRMIGFGDEMDSEVWRLNDRKGTLGEAWQTAEIIGVKPGAMSGWSMDGETKFVDREVKTANSAAAQQWAGFGTSLKPAFEPITVARKPIVGTVAENVQRHGTGAMNIDGCRIASDDGSDHRWPANFTHDGSDEATAPLGSASRYFYCPKASKSDRGPSNDWPTVKPTDLMRYLVRLVTPPGGLVADPWMGSGSTGKAAILEGFRFLGIDKDEHAFEIAGNRVEGARLSRHDPTDVPSTVVARSKPRPKSARRDESPMFAFAEEGGSP